MIIVTYWQTSLSLCTHCDCRLVVWQTLGIDSHELNRFRFGLLFFENSRTIPMALKRIRTELNLEFGQLWTQLNPTHNGKKWWMNWTVCWRILMKLYLWVIDSTRTELILTTSERVYSERLSSIQNPELNLNIWDCCSYHLLSASRIFTTPHSHCCYCVVT